MTRCLSFREIQGQRENKRCIWYISLNAEIVIEIIITLQAFFFSPPPPSSSCSFLTLRMLKYALVHKSINHHTLILNKIPRRIKLQHLETLCERAYVMRKRVSRYTVPRYIAIKTEKLAREISSSFPPLDRWPSFNRSTATM